MHTRRKSIFLVVLGFCLAWVSPCWAESPPTCNSADIIDIATHDNGITHTPLGVSGNGDLIVRIEGLRNTNGYVQVLLFNHAEDYPIHADGVYRMHTLLFKSQVIECRFNNIPLGDYALAVIHDENANYELDLGLLGIPSEGVTASNGAKGFFGPPQWKDAKFLMDTPQYNVTLKMHYGISYWI